MKLCNHVCVSALPSLYLHRFWVCICVWASYSENEEIFFFGTIFLFHRVQNEIHTQTNERKWKAATTTAAAAAAKLNSVSRIIYTSANMYCVHSHTQAFFFLLCTCDLCERWARSHSLFLSLMFASYVYARKHSHSHTPTDVHTCRGLCTFWIHKYTPDASWYVCAHTHTHFTRYLSLSFKI